MKAMTMPPMVTLYFVCDQLASLMKMSTTIGSVKRYSSASRHRKMSRKEERVEKPWTM